MAVRKIHNKIAKMVIPDLDMKDIDEVNRMVDDPAMLRKYGRYHRSHWGHDLNSTAPDSMKINKGDARREKARQIHIVVDTDPRVKLVAKKMEIDAQIKALRKMK